MVRLQIKTREPGYWSLSEVQDISGRRMKLRYRGNQVHLIGMLVLEGALRPYRVVSELIRFSNSIGCHEQTYRAR